MSLVTTGEVEALLAPGIDPSPLQDLIDREESFLADRIGQLVGERTVTLMPRSTDLRYAGPLYLQRPAPAVEVEDGGTAAVVTLYGRRAFMRDDLLPWVYPVVVTYTRDDEPEVKTAVLELVRVALASSPYNQESADGHSYSKPVSAQLIREAIAKRLLRVPRTMAVPFR